MVLIKWKNNDSQFNLHTGMNALLKVQQETLAEIDIRMVILGRDLKSLRYSLC